MEPRPWRSLERWRGTGGIQCGIDGDKERRKEGRKEGGSCQLQGFWGRNDEDGGKQVIPVGSSKRKIEAAAGGGRRDRIEARCSQSSTLAPDTRSRLRFSWIL